MHLITHNIAIEEYSIEENYFCVLIMILLWVLIYLTFYNEEPINMTGELSWAEQLSQIVMVMASQTQSLSFIL